MFEGLELSQDPPDYGIEFDPPVVHDFCAQLGELLIEEGLDLLNQLPEEFRAVFCHLAQSGNLLSDICFNLGQVDFC